MKSGMLLQWFSSSFYSDLFGESLRISPKIPNIASENEKCIPETPNPVIQIEQRNYTYREPFYRLSR